jgi:hypothetical protein
MTTNEILQIKKMLEGNYPKLKDSEDAVFVMMLADYQFGLMAEASKNFMMTSKFPPTIANLLEEYEKVKLYRKTEIVRQMNNAGIFKDQSEFLKATRFIERDIIPDWFKTKMINFVEGNQKLGADKQLLLGLVS